jgi:hypothetical protein
MIADPEPPYPGEAEPVATHEPAIEWEALPATPAWLRPVPAPTIDRLPPQNLDSERAVLGSILIDRDALGEVSDFLAPGDFYRQAHGRVFAAMLAINGRGEPLDVVTVAAELERTGELEAAGGASFLSQLGNDTPTSIHVAQYARIVAGKAVLRRLIGAAGKIAAIGYEDGADIQESIGRAEAELDAIGAGLPRAAAGEPIARLGARLLSSVSTAPASPPLRGRMDPTAATFLHGTGGVGKGTLAASWIVGLIEEWAPRVQALGGLAARESILYVCPAGPEWRGRRGPLWTQAPELRELADEHGATYLVVDSVVPACAGTDPLKPEAASQYFGGLQIIGRPSLSLAHTPKATDLAYPFGSVFYHNLARLTWSLERTKGGSLLVNRKANRYGFLGRFVVTPTWYDGALGEVAERPYLAVLADRIADALAEGPLTVPQIVARLSEDDDGEEIKANSLRHALKRGAQSVPPRFEEIADRWQVAP